MPLSGRRSSRIGPVTLMCSLPYWRKNLWNGSACRAILMIQESGRLRAWDPQGVVLFDSSVTEVHTQISRAGTLILRVDNRKWTFVGRGSQVSPKPTEAQHKTVVGFWQAHQGFEPANTIKGPGLADQIFNGSAAWHMRLWHNSLIRGGAHED